MCTCSSYSSHKKKLSSEFSDPDQTGESDISQTRTVSQARQSCPRKTQLLKNTGMARKKILQHSSARSRFSKNEGKLHCCLFPNGI
jgi:hypothetical protein